MSGDTATAHLPDGGAHAGSMRQFVRFAHATGLALDRILDAELTAILATSATVERVPAHSMVDILQVCAVVAKRPALGVALAAWGSMRAYGPLGLLWDHAPTLAEAERVNQRYLHLEHAALGTMRQPDGDDVALRHLLLIPVRYGGSQFLESTLTLKLRMVRMILGEAWKPLRVEFAHAAPADTRYHRTIFRCPIEFGADRDALIVRADDMVRAAPNGNAHMFAYLERHLEAADRARPDDLPRQVTQAITARLAGGNAALDTIAAALGMSARTLQRQLAASGATFAMLLEAARGRVAEEYSRAARRPSLTQLAYRLGYADASAASRYLRMRRGR